MADKETLLRKFGPKLLEAICIVITAESNRIRDNVGMPAITQDQVLTEIETALETVPNYDWMENGN